MFIRNRLIDHIDRPITLPRSRNHFTGWLTIVCVGLIVAGFAFGPFSSGKSAMAASACPQGATLNIVAHEDDDLLFLNPDTLHAIQSGRCVRTIIVTAGDAGGSATYWQGREAGSQAAYAQMGGVANAWTQTDAGIAGHPISVYTLTAKPTVSLAFMQLPDGNIDGSGFTSTNFEGLQKLWQGTITTIHAIDGSSSYTKATLTSTFTSLMSSFQPDQINTQDYAGAYGDGDHSDHHSVAYFAQVAQQQYTTAHNFTGYQDYNTTPLAVNVTGTDLTAKQNAFLAYAADDPNVCQSIAICANTSYAGWLQRQYTVGSGANQTLVASAGSNLTVTANTTVQLDGSGSVGPAGNALTYQWTQTAGPSVTLSSATDVQPTFTAPASATSLTFQLTVNNGLTSSQAMVTVAVSTSANLAPSATATASSQNTSTGQTADKAIDGVIDGSPGDYTKEWSTVSGGVGSWLKLTWTAPQTVSRVVLYDRPNLSDQVTGGNIQFSDGSSVMVGALNNNDAATTISFPAKTITSLQFNITSVSTSTQNVGLAEIQVYNDSPVVVPPVVVPPVVVPPVVVPPVVVPPVVVPPVANAGSDQSVGVNTTVQLNGSGSSDSAGNALVYQWTQTAGAAVTLSNATAAKPTFMTSANIGSLTFQLVVNNGKMSSSPDTVTIIVNNTADLALSATATASSQSVSTGQTAAKAIDGVIAGAPASPTNEWVTTGGGIGSWIKLTWAKPQTISRIVLYGRPSVNDQIQGGIVQFSNFGFVLVGPLNNNATATTITFPTQTVTSIQFNVTWTSLFARNVGLAEIQAYKS